MEALLFLAHRIPYPPNKGDKIRSFRWLKSLAARYRIHLGAFVDDPKDWRHAPKLESMCEDVCLVDLHPRMKKLKSLSGLLNGEALSIPYYRSRKLQTWISEKLEKENVSRVLVFSSPMTQYVMGARSQRIKLVVDFVDVDSEKWRHYAKGCFWPLSWVYRREGDALLRFEREAARASDVSVFVSMEESELFCHLAPELRGKVIWIRNGVDTEFFSPHRYYENPYAVGDRVLVFTGAMDYWANVDAVQWFSRKVFPEIRKRLAQARLFIVGARPARDVLRLASAPGVEVTGGVEDTRPYIAHARAAIAPLRLARGVQNKILEAMAMARPVLATESAVEGIDMANGLKRFVTADPETLVQRGMELLEMGEKDNAMLGMRARRHVEEHYDWDSSMQKMARLMETTSPSLQSQATPIRAEAANG